MTHFNSGINRLNKRSDLDNLNIIFSNLLDIDLRLHSNKDFGTNEESVSVVCQRCYSGKFFR